MARVLVIDADPAVSGVLWSTLATPRLRVVTVGPSAHIGAAVAEHGARVVILGPRLAEQTSVHLLCALRRWFDGPVLAVCGRDDPEHAIEVLDAGADDYVRVPFAMAEVAARVRALLRRVPAAPEQVVVTDAFTVDLTAMRVVKDGREVHLTPTEWGMLQMLVRNRGKLVGRTELLSQVWGASRSHKTHYLRVYLGSLRRKLENDPAHPRHLLTETGLGYRFVV